MRRQTCLRYSCHPYISCVTLGKIPGLSSHKRQIASKRHEVTMGESGYVIVIYNKYIFGLCPLFLTELKKNLDIS